MEEEGIGLVLGRATELRLKISNCIHKGSHSPSKRDSGVHADGKAADEVEEEKDEEEVEQEEAYKLFNICDALESLENQLSSLQALQQQQTYEREVALSEIESSRKMLVDKLKEYKGEDLEVLREASAFAGETVEHNNDLLLPPYPSRSPHTLSLQNGYLPPPTHKLIRNEIITGDPTNEAKKNSSETDKLQNGSKKRLGFFLTTAAKTLLTLVGVASVLRLSGFGPKFVRSNVTFKISGLSQQPPTEEKRSTIECPPGRVLVVEDGKARCVVKERVEVPFSSVVARPDINFGCG